VVNSGLWRAETPSLRKMRPISNTRSRPPTTSRFSASSAGPVGSTVSKIQAFIAKSDAHHQPLQYQLCKLIGASSRS
jgi:hypothetical protein